LEMWLKWRGDGKESVRGGSERPWRWGGGFRGEVSLKSGRLVGRIQVGVRSQGESEESGGRVEG
jgi:hypothetical protein